MSDKATLRGLVLAHSLGVQDVMVGGREVGV